jgi:lipopolysaccharide transport system ATP-binding protein
MMAPAIFFKKVSKNYPLYHHFTGGFKSFLFNFPEALASIRKTRFEVFSDVSFQIEKGETVGFIGRNGAGKSTLLGLIAGVLRQSAGDVVVNGRVSPLLELGGGFHYELTGRENILLNGVLLGLLRSEIKNCLNDIIEFSELGEFIDQPIKTYSSGMLSRLGFSVVAHLNPEILLVDEILAVGDFKFQEKCLSKLDEFRSRGVTIVLVSHNAADIQKHCNRVVWLEDKRVKMIGPPEEVLPHYAG